eukprot:2679306-Pyramimonas_sp.AAC.2
MEPLDQTSHCFILSCGQQALPFPVEVEQQKVLIFLQVANAMSLDGHKKDNANNKLEHVQSHT